MHEVIQRMRTEFADEVNAENVWRSYPRPQLVRDSYLNLNGMWEYAIRREEAVPDAYNGQLLVPFSPEAALSGVNRQLQPDESLFYRRTFRLPEGFFRERLLLHFGAVDQSCEVYVNGAHAGSHCGGYLPFSLDITDSADSAGENTIVLRVRDVSDKSYYAKGKQCLNRGGIWYTAQSGIWQTVWLESTPEQYVRSLVITPDYDNAQVTVSVNSAGEPLPWQVSVLAQGKTLAQAEGGTEPAVLSLPDFHAWSPEDPFLYDLEIQYGADRVTSYFGMRKISVGQDSQGMPRLLLNNRPYFHNGLLDQGYWPDGLLTPPSEEAVVYDLEQTKSLGFNMLRKHIKIEPDLWYYHCDRLGILVWQDFVNGGRWGTFLLRNRIPSLRLTTSDTKKHYRAMGRRDEAGRAMQVREAKETIRHLGNHPCIVVWVPFNEGWGQFDSEAMYRMVKELDPTRPVDHASGWHDQGCGDFNSRHDYSKQPVIRSDHRVKALTEFGGLALALEGHTFQTEKEMFGYQTFHSIEEQDAAFRALYEGYILAEIPKGLCASVYTQLTDVEDELNGLMTYDRKRLKFTPELLKEINRKIADCKI
ncbi:MAG: glycoside hydrolase family 2 [Clostridiales bacterium]|nr:glycoside hydrolase family 2 [Clostridiales bacterium]